MCYVNHFRKPTVQAENDANSKGFSKMCRKALHFSSFFSLVFGGATGDKGYEKIQGQILKSRKNDLQVHQVAIPGWKSFTDVDRWNLQRISPTKKVSVPLLECFCSAKKTHIQSFCRTKERGEWDNLDPLKCVFFWSKTGNLWSDMGKTKWRKRKNETLHYFGTMAVELKLWLQFQQTDPPWRNWT